MICKGMEYIRNIMGKDWYAFSSQIYQDRTDYRSFVGFHLKMKCMLDVEVLIEQHEVTSSF